MTAGPRISAGVPAANAAAGFAAFAAGRRFWILAGLSILYFLLTGLRASKTALEIDVRARMLHLSDRQLAIEFDGYDTDELTMAAFQRWTGWRVEPYREFVGKHPRFVVVDSGGLFAPGDRNRSGWLLADRASLALVGQWQGRSVYDVMLPGPR